MQKTTFAVLALLVAGLLPAAADAKGKDIAPGQLVKGTSTSSVYYIDEDLTRHAFPNEHVFKSWYKDFSGVVVTDDETLAKYPLAGLVPYKAATRLVKVQSDPKVYAVDDGGELRWVKNERVAKALYGENWADMVDDLADSFFANYVVGDDVEDDEDFNEQLHLFIEDIMETLRTKRAKWLAKRGAHTEEFENHGYGRTKVALCHAFDDHAHTIYVAKPAKAAHLAHGDTVGACEGDENDDNGDVTGPVISGVAFTGIGDHAATVSFTTNERARIAVYYTTHDPFSFDHAELVSIDEYSKEHSVALSELASGNTYRLVIKAWDEHGNRTVLEGQTFATTGEHEEVDDTGPVISGVAFVDVTETSAVLELTTDENAKIRAYYTSVSPFDFGNAALVQTEAFAVSHSLAIDGLEADTEYLVVIKAEDAEGNLTVHPETSFSTAAPDTTNPTVSLLQVNEVGETTATVHIEADEHVTAVVYYSTTSPVDTGSAASVTSGTLASAHDVALTGLATGTTYYVWVEVEDEAGNDGTAGETDFTTVTPDVTAPVVDPLTIGTPTDSTVAINLVADEEVTATVYYAASPSVDTGTADHVSSETLSTTHEIELTGLTPETTYYVIVEVEDGSGNAWTSTEDEFTTAAAA